MSGHMARRCEFDENGRTLVWSVVGIWLVWFLCCVVGWFGSLYGWLIWFFVVRLAGLVLLLYGWLVWFFFCTVGWFGSFLYG
jgi:hypothetical protein